MKRSILSSITPFVATALLLSGPFQTHAQDVDPTESGSTNQTQEAADVVVETTNGASTDAAVTTAEVPAASTESAADEPAAATADETSGTTFERAATDPVDTAAQSPADPPAATTSGAATAAAAVTMTQMYNMLQKQQSQLDAQKRQIEDQKKLIVALQVGADKELQTEKDVTAKQAEEIESQRQTMASMQTQIDQINQKSAADLSKEDVELRSRLETLESSIQASQDAASTTFDEDSFPNSTMIPGTNAAMRMGGFVKMNIVETFDPLASLDRFIANSIPVPQESTTPRTSMTVSQSRLNWDLRDKTKFGVMRAYIEGDFAGDSTTFRLRHAFGQFKDVLAGKTWTVFQDVDAMPEELDFEGINGAVNVRQSQVRYFPKVGGDWNLMFSLEDPNPEITGGTATSKIPDLVASARRTWFDRWHIRSSVVLRQITGIWDLDDTGDTESQVTGWGISFSGKTATQFWNDTGSDNFLFQLNAGKGIGRYINDLNTLGGQDAIFDLEGNLVTLPVFGGYVAYQHWWRDSARSTVNLSWVNVDNTDFQAGFAYHRTFRGAVNYIWSPTPRIDLGAEIIYGTRENKDKQKANATQLQISTKYRF
jgi:hypothetical protein